MAGFRVRETGEYLQTRYALEQYRRKIGGVPADITDHWLDSAGLDAVFEGPQATPSNVYEFSQFAGLEKQSDGKWYTKYVLGPVFYDDEESTAEEKLAAYKKAKDAEVAASVRAQRNQMLAESDWTQMPDAPTFKHAWIEYRQALRNVPKQSGFPYNVTWPVKP